MECIRVVCAAGASSTFLVHWMRREASSRGLDLAIEATSCDERQLDLAGPATVLVSHHLADRFPSIAQRADAAQSRAILLPPLTFDRDGAAAALDLALAAGIRAGDAEPRPTVHDSTDAR